MHTFLLTCSLDSQTKTTTNLAATSPKTTPASSGHVVLVWISELLPSISSPNTVYSVFLYFCM